MPSDGIVTNITYMWNIGVWLPHSMHITKIRVSRVVVLKFDLFGQRRCIRRRVWGKAAHLDKKRVLLKVRELMKVK